MKLVKIDDESGSPLSGAEFKVTLPNGSEITKSTNENGILDLGKIEISKTGTDIIKIEELKAPIGYSKMFNKLEVEVTKEERSGAYIVTGVKFRNSEATGIGGTKSATVNYENNTVTVTVPNVKKEGGYDVQILKVDNENQTPLSGAEFKVTLPNGSIITNTTNENGILNIDRIDITELGTDVIKIEELNAPTGYNKTFNSFDLEVTKGEKNGTYVVLDIKLNNAQGSGLAEGSLSVHREDSLITITVPNVKKQGNYNLEIQKVDSSDNSVKLEGAEFSVKVNENTETMTTGIDGLTTLKTIDIENLNNDTIEIIETKAPEGYNSLIGTITLEVVKKETENGYSVSNINFENTENVSATLEGNTIKIVVKNEKKEFDLSLRKYISKINDTEYQREPQVDLTNLKEGVETTAIYNHPKTAITVKRNDLITYTIRVYNEGEVAGYVNEVTDYLPEELEFANDNETNKQYGWVLSSDGRTVTTDYLSQENDVDGNNLIKAFDGENLDYRDLQIVCKIKDTAEGGKKLTNIAEISDEYNEYDIEDKDSKPEDLNYPNEEELPQYKDDEINKEYVPGQEDDDDFEKVIVQEVTGNYKLQIEKVDSLDNNIKLQNAIFSVKVNGSSIGNLTTGEDGLTSLHTIDITDVNSVDTIEIEEINAPQWYNSLIGKITLEVIKEDIGTAYETKEIKFENNENVNASLENGIIKIVVKNKKKEFDLSLRKFITKVEDEDITNRIPEVSYDGEKITYNHTKEPVQLVSGNTVIYTIRVYNEGEIAGYAKEITDDIPEGLEFLPENETNVEYRWVMYDEEGNITEDVSKAVSVKTDYLSKEQEEEVGDNLLQAFDKEAGISEENPSFRDVKIAFKVVEPNESDRILVNSAQISDDSDEDGKEVTDKDSTPDEWIDGEDDQDREYVELLYFDLSLRKWVTQAIVIDKNGETITETGHQPYDDPEEIVKVELHRKHINDVTVKFRYKIRVTNEGEIAGYAKEVTDYIPEGLRFIAEDNPGWTDEGNNVISTRLLENTLLQPGEYAEVEVVLTWINDEKNMGLKVNTAEISEDYNDYDVPDIDSTPDNREEGEDDIDDAPVMLSVGTGTARTYFTLGLVVLVTIAGGVFLIKKYIL